VSPTSAVKSLGENVRSPFAFDTLTTWFGPDEDVCAEAAAEVVVLLPEP
jgi:hypothetical protein